MIMFPSGRNQSIDVYYKFTGCFYMSGKLEKKRLKVQVIKIE